MSSRRLLLSHNKNKNKNKTQRTSHNTSKKGTRHRLLYLEPHGLQSSSTAKGLNPTKLAIKHYLQHIYKYLDVKYCFVSGAFVIEDADGKLLALMEAAPKHKVIARTHDVYLDRKTTIMYETHFPDKYEFIVTCKCDAEEIKVKTVKRVTEKKIHEKIPLKDARELLEKILAAEKEEKKAETLRLSEDYVLEEEGEGEAELLDEKEYKEEDKVSNDFIRTNYDEFVAAFAAALEQHDTVSRPVRNIKWYPFTDKIDKKRYMYIKLEDSETISIAHLMDMYRRYGPGKALQCVKSRREDCFKEKATGEICRFDVATEKRREKETAFDSPKTITLPDQPKTAIAIKETYDRKGDEMFIPQELNTFLLRNKEAKVKFTYDDGSEHVMVTTQGGGRRSKRKTRTRKNSKRSKTNKKKTRRSNKKS